MHTPTPQPHNTGSGQLITRVTGVAVAAGLLLGVAAPAHAETTATCGAPGTSPFIVPNGVSQISAVMTGAGGGGGGGGCLPGNETAAAWKGGTSGENSTFIGPHGGASAQGGAGGELVSKYSGGHGGKGGILFGWGGDSGPTKEAFTVGRAGTSSSSGKGGAGGAAVGVAKSCPTSTGVGGNGGLYSAEPGYAGGNGCVVITY